MIWRIVLLAALATQMAVTAFSTWSNHELALALSGLAATGTVLEIHSGTVYFGRDEKFSTPCAHWSYRDPDVRNAETRRLQASRCYERT